MPLTAPAVQALHAVILECCTDFARLAGIPNSSEWKPEDVFYDAIKDGLLPPESKDELGKRCSAITNTMIDLYKQFDELAVFLKQRFPKFNGQVTLKSVTTTHPPLKLNLPEIAKEIYVLTCNWAHFNPPRRLGRPSGSRAYPYVDNLIYLLEFRAQCVSGHFTVHRKLGEPKGSLIQALDRLRNRLGANPDLLHLAKLIPPSKSHPVSVYEAALNRARKDAIPSGRPPARRDPLIP
jgi:hypothetical protein